MTSTSLKTGVKHVGSHAPWREDMEVPDPSHPGLLYRHGPEGKQGIRVLNSKIRLPSVGPEVRGTRKPPPPPRSRFLLDTSLARVWFPLSPLW